MKINTDQLHFLIALWNSTQTIPQCIQPISSDTSDIPIFQYYKPHCSNPVLSSGKILENTFIISKHNPKLPTIRIVSIYTPMLEDRLFFLKLIIGYQYFLAVPIGQVRYQFAIFIYIKKITSKVEYPFNYYQFVSFLE